MKNTWKPFLLVFSVAVIFASTVYFTKSTTYYIQGQMVPQSAYEEVKADSQYRDLASKRDDIDELLGLITGGASGLILTVLLYRKQIFGMS